MTDDGTVITPPATPPSSVVPSVPSDYEELRQFRAAYEPAIQRISEHWDDIQPLLEDEAQREFYHRSRDAYKAELERQKPRLSPELQSVRDEFEGVLKPVVEYIDTERKTKEEIAKKSVEDAQAANLAYANRLIAERPDLAEEDYWGMHSLAALAARDRISVEDAWKKYSSRFSGPAPKREAPPKSMRASESAPGVPGPSAEKPIRSKGDLVRRLSANLQAGGMKG